MFVVEESDNNNKSVMDTEKCKIKLNSPENIYFAGQQIKGQITIILQKRTKIQGKF